MRSLSERFWAKVERGDISDCWLWTGAKQPFGYGMCQAELEKEHRPPAGRENLKLILACQEHEPAMQKGRGTES